MDEGTLQTSISTYKQQLQQVEMVLLSAGSDGQTELVRLRDDLKQVIQLTEESLLSLRKSELLSLVDTAASGFALPADPCTPADPRKPLITGDAENDFDKEFAEFKAAVGDGDDAETIMIAPNPTSSTKLLNDSADDADEEEDISGTKCSIYHTEEWGGRQRLNAVVMSTEPRDTTSEEISLRVLFCNPTSKSMKPCPYYLEGTCRFREEDCRFSHGYIVRLSELHPFFEPDFSLLKLGGPCLARYADDVWYPASVQHIDSDEHQVTIEFESYGTTSVLDVQSILPLVHSESTSPSISSSSEDDDDETSIPSTSSTSQAKPNRDDEADFPCIAWRPSGDGVPLGQWEAHTRGIASKLMAKMGYELGKGLGKHGEGRVLPVEAVIMPQGKSLDKCMELREMKKLGIVVKKKKKKGKGKGHGSKKTGGETSTGVETRKINVFDFINKKLGGKKAKLAELVHRNMDCKRFLEKDAKFDSREADVKPDRKLNIQLVKTQEEIRSTERELTRLQDSLQRNQRDKLTASHLQTKITSTEHLLHSLKSSERKILSRQNSREQHKKLTIF